MTDNCSRRDFLAQSAAVVALTAANSTLEWARGSDTPYVELNELSATAVIAAMKRIRVGRVALAALPPGQWRYLMPYERF